MVFVFLVLSVFVFLFHFLSQLKHSFLSLAKRVINMLKLTPAATPAPEDIPSVSIFLDTTETTSCSINFSTPDGGRLVLLCTAKDAALPLTTTLKTFTDNPDTLPGLYASFPGILEVKVLPLPRGQSEGAWVFESLTPSTAYNFVAYLDCSLFADEVQQLDGKKKKIKGQKNYCNMPGLYMFYIYINLSIHYSTCITTCSYKCSLIFIIFII